MYDRRYQVNVDAGGIEAPIAHSIDLALTSDIS